MPSAVLRLPANRELLREGPGQDANDHTFTPLTSLGGSEWL